MVKLMYWCGLLLNKYLFRGIIVYVQAEPLCGKADDLGQAKNITKKYKRVFAYFF